MSDRLQRSMALMDAKADVKMIKERANECWYDTKILANAVYLILEELTVTDTADTPQTESHITCYGTCTDKCGAYENGDCTLNARKADTPQTDCGWR